MDELDKYFLHYCIKNFDSFEDFEEASGRIFHKYKLIKSMKKRELTMFLKLVYHEFIEDFRQEHLSFDQFVKKMHPISKKRLELLD